MLAWFLLQFTRFYEHRMFIWNTMACVGSALTVAAMIAIAQPSEPAYLLYPIGLMLPMMTIYFLLAHFWYATIAGWTMVAAYLVVGVSNQLLASFETSRLFFIMVFFLVAMNMLGMVLG